MTQQLDLNINIMMSTPNKDTFSAQSSTQDYAEASKFGDIFNTANKSYSNESSTNYSAVKDNSYARDNGQTKDLYKNDAKAVVEQSNETTEVVNNKDEEITNSNVTEQVASAKVDTKSEQTEIKNEQPVVETLKDLVQVVEDTVLEKAPLIADVVEETTTKDLTLEKSLISDEVSVDNELPLDALTSGLYQPETVATQNIKMNLNESSVELTQDMMATVEEELAQTDLELPTDAYITTLYQSNMVENNEVVLSVKEKLAEALNKNIEDFNTKLENDKDEKTIKNKIVDALLKNDKEDKKSAKIDEVDVKVVAEKLDETLNAEDFITESKELNIEMINDEDKSVVVEPKLVINEEIENLNLKSQIETVVKNDVMVNNEVKAEDLTTVAMNVAQETSTMNVELAKTATKAQETLAKIDDKMPAQDKLVQSELNEKIENVLVDTEALDNSIDTNKVETMPKETLSNTLEVSDKVATKDIQNEKDFAQLNKDVKSEKMERLADKVDVKEKNLIKEVKSLEVENEINQSVQLDVAEDAVINIENVKVEAEANAKAKDVLEKVGLSSDKLNAMDAKITAMESTQSGSSNSFGQSAQEMMLQNDIQGLEETSPKSMDNFSQTLSKATQSQTTEQTPMQNIEEKDIISQIYAKMKATNIGGTQKIVMGLTPEALGKVNIEIMSGKDGMTANILAENAQVKEILEKNLDGLKTALQSQGVSMNNVNVKVAEAEKSSNQNEMFNQNEENSAKGESNNNGSQNSNNTGKERQSEFEMFNKTVLSEMNGENEELEQNIQMTGKTVDLKVGMGNVKYQV